MKTGLPRHGTVTSLTHLDRRQIDLGGRQRQRVARRVERVDERPDRDRGIHGTERASGQKTTISACTAVMGLIKVRVAGVGHPIPRVSAAYPPAAPARSNTPPPYSSSGGKNNTWAGAERCRGFWPRRNCAVSKSCILLFLWGGPPQQDMWDMKPDAPEGIRSAFRADPDQRPRHRICDQMPLLAQHADKLASSAR